MWEISRFSRCVTVKEKVCLGLNLASVTVTTDSFGSWVYLCLRSLSLCFLRIHLCPVSPKAKRDSCQIMLYRFCFDFPSALLLDFIYIQDRRVLFFYFIIMYETIANILISFKYLFCPLSSILPFLFFIFFFYALFLSILSPFFLLSIYSSFLSFLLLSFLDLFLSYPLNVLQVQQHLTVL